jgi:hypothetical protein
MLLNLYRWELCIGSDSFVLWFFRLGENKSFIHSVDNLPSSVIGFCDLSVRCKRHESSCGSHVTATTGCFITQWSGQLWGADGCVTWCISFLFVNIAQLRVSVIYFDNTWYFGSRLTDVIIWFSVWPVTWTCNVYEGLNAVLDIFKYTGLWTDWNICFRQKLYPVMKGEWLEPCRFRDDYHLSPIDYTHSKQYFEYRHL